MSHIHRILAAVLLLLSALAPAADALDLVERSFIPLGRIEALDHQHTTLMVGQGAYVVYWDLAITAAPVRTGYVATSGRVAGIAVSGSYTYAVTTDGIVEVIDHSNPSQPLRLATMDTGRPARSCIVVNDVLVVGHEDNNWLIDVSSPELPFEIATIPGDDSEFAAFGDWLFAGAGDVVLVYDLSNRNAPLHAATIDADGARGLAVSDDGHYLYIGGESFRVVDISAPGNPMPMGTVGVRTELLAAAVPSSTSLVFGIVEHTVHTIDVQDPQVPVRSGTLFDPLADPARMATGVEYMAEKGNLVAAFDDRVILYHAPDHPPYGRGPELPAPGGDNTGIVLHPDGTHVLVRQPWVGSAFAAGRFAVVDAGDIQSPSVATVVRPGGVAGAVYSGPIDTSQPDLQGDVLYVAELVFGMTLRDITNLDDPGSYVSVGASGYVHGTAVSGRQLYVASLSSRGSNDKLEVFSLDNALAPEKVGEADWEGTNGLFLPRKVVVDGTIAYVGGPSRNEEFLGWTGGVRIIDVRTPPSPFRMGGGINLEGLRTFDALDKFIYIGMRGGGFVIYDVRIANNPRLRGGIIVDEGLPVHDVDVVRSDDRVLALIAAEAGVVMVDVTDPDTPVEVDRVETHRGVRAIAVAGNRVYASGEGGFHVLEFGVLPTRVAMDITPGACPNPLALAGGRGAQRGSEAAGGVLKVAVLGSGEVGVRDIDVATLSLEGVAPIAHQWRDVATAVAVDDDCPCPPAQKDGELDLVLTFARADVAAAIGPAAKRDRVVLTLEGTMLDGRRIEARDCVTVVGGSGPIRVPGPEEVVLHAATPNPFNPVTHIRYYLPRSMHVKLSVFDVAGRHVATLVDGVQPSGDREVVWRADGLSSGVYFYRITAGDFTATRKLVLLK